VESIPTVDSIFDAPFLGLKHKIRTNTESSYQLGISTANCRVDFEDGLLVKFSFKT
jgi:hypothetical protein